jgi:AMP deaminase
MHVFKAPDLSMQALGVGDGTDAVMWQRFDKFNEKYEPFGVKSLREVFLKHDNFVQGRFLADITQEVIGGDAHNCDHVYLEPRLSIYGRSENEWEVLAAWIVRYNLVSKRVKWMVQIPRIFRKIAESMASVDASAAGRFSFQTMLCNIFKPLFEVTADPRRHPNLHQASCVRAASDSRRIQ